MDRGATTTSSTGLLDTRATTPKSWLDTTSGEGATSGNMRLETIAAEAKTSKGRTHEQQLLRAGHNIRNMSNFWQHEAGDDSSRSNNF